MKTEAIPVHSLPLTADQAESMLQRQIKKHHIAIILLHWFNAIVWFFELLTGLALIVSPLFRVAPQWYIAIVEGGFGTRANMLQFHVALGLAWIGVYLVYGTFGFRTYLSMEVLEKEIALDQDDWRWLVVRTQRILGLTKEALPPQGIYNAGQKLFALMVYAMVPLVMVTGIVMAFRLFDPQVVGWAVVLHFCAVSAVVCGLMVHVYMGAVFPEEKPAFFSMITGTVNELYAYSHHFKWWTAVKAEQREWDRRHDKEAVTPVDAGVPD
ncbi:MAG: cytochrome b/b6 domain-containing protein [Acidobacteria bacterium]|nr:cytochrome b/b6 domain-containing protein [Acidobacteriota bacterium]